MVEELGEAPVDEVDLAEGADHHVLGLEVAVDDAVGVGEGEGVADLEEDLEGSAVAVEVAGGQLAHHVGQVCPSSSFIVKNRGPSSVRQLVDRDDVRVLELRRDPGLAEEGLDHLRLGPELGQEALDRQLAAQGAVGEELDRGHSPFAEPARAHMALAAAGNGRLEDALDLLLAGLWRATGEAEEPPGPSPQALARGLHAGARCQHCRFVGCLGVGSAHRGSLSTGSGRSRAARARRGSCRGAWRLPRLRNMR